MLKSISPISSSYINCVVIRKSKKYSDKQNLIGDSLAFILKGKTAITQGDPIEQ